MALDLVRSSEHGIKGINYYWERREKFNITTDELRQVGVDGNFAYIDASLVPKLEAVNGALAEHGYGIIIKDGYRSPELYALVQQKRYALDGKENTDRTLNTERMIHASGFAVDVNIFDLNNNNELELWDKADWPDGAFVDFYKDRHDQKSERYQALQTLLARVMFSEGFSLGTLREFWHFEAPVE